MYLHFSSHVELVAVFAAALEHAVERAEDDGAHEAHVLHLVHDGEEGHVDDAHLVGIAAATAAGGRVEGEGLVLAKSGMSTISIPKHYDYE